MLNDALRYLRLGWSVIPVCWPVEGACGCGRGHTGNQIGKAPLLPTWKEYQSRLATLDEVTQWWTRYPLANIACLTGAISRMAVVDLEYEGLAEAERLGLSSGLISQTGKGRHLIYSHPGGKVCGTTKLNGVRGFDVRGDGNYIILPPSMHTSGKRYRWLTPVFGAGAFTPFPDSIFVGSAREISKSVTAKPQGWISEALASLSDGNRNDTFAKVVGRLHGQRWCADDIRSLLLPHAVRVEFSAGELDGVIRSVTRYPVEVRGGSRSNAVAGGSEPATKLAVRQFSTDWTDYQARKNGDKHDEYATGYHRFDALLNGGLIRERLLTVAARTGVGKTNWLLGICRHLSSRGKRTLYLSTELSYKKIWDRYIPLVGSEDEARKHSLIVSDEFVPDTRAIRQAVAEHKPDVLVFDHIHNVSEENTEVGQYMKALAEIVKDARIPGVVAAQLNKNAYFVGPDGKRMNPHLGMIKGASAIIQVSGQVVILDERDETPEQRDILAVLDKNSDGEKGLVSFVLRKQPYRMEEA